SAPGQLRCPARESHRRSARPTGPWFAGGHSPWSMTDGYSRRARQRAQVRQPGVHIPAAGCQLHAVIPIPDCDYTSELTGPYSYQAALSAELHIASPGVKTESAARRGEYLQRSRPRHLRVRLRMNSQHIVSAQVGNDELVAGDKADTISSSADSLSGNHKRHLSYEVTLILRSQVRGIAAGIHQGGQYVVTIGKTHAARIAQLDGSCLSSVINCRGQ